MLQNPAAVVIVSDVFDQQRLMSQIHVHNKSCQFLILQQSCFRGYRYFVRYIIIQYFIIKIQACVRSYQAKSHLKKLKREERNKKIQKNKKLSDAMSRVSLNHMKKSHPCSAANISLSSIYFPPNNKSCVGKELHQKKAALIIERFFIKIRAEIEYELVQLEQRERSRRGKKKRKERTRQQSSQKGVRRSAYNSF